MTIQRLPYHLPGENSWDDSTEDDNMHGIDVEKAKFLMWMVCNRLSTENRRLTYIEFGSKSIWNPRTNWWNPRRVGVQKCIIPHVDVFAGEIYYLRVLLHVIKGPGSYFHLRTVGGVTYPTFKHAWEALGLLDDDREKIEILREASEWASRRSLRQMFVFMIDTHEIIDPLRVWSATNSLKF